MDITQQSSRVVYANDWLRVREDDIAFGDGRPGVYGVVEKPGSALVVPMEDDGVHLVEQFRYPLGRRCWEFPQGSFDPDDHDPLAAGRRELVEETGLWAHTMTLLGRIAVAPGFCDQSMHVFVATDLERREPRRDVSEQDMHQAFVHRRELTAMIADGTVEDACSLAAYGLLLAADG